MRRLFWNLRYLFGQPPWDTGVTPPELVELIESGEAPPGRALDIGCGTGTNAIYLAQHGFDVVGVDIAWLAIREARRKARRAGVAIAFHTGAVVRLGTADGPPLGDPFDLAVDIGCVHSLPPPDLSAYAAMLGRALREGGLYLLYAWGPRRLLGRDVGFTPDEAQSFLADDFRTRWIREGEERGSASCWYLFERRASSGAS
jgi:SAM-dependent methyltransferase